LKIKHIYWFAPYNLNGPSTRYRGYYPLKYFSKNFKIEFDFVFPDRSTNGMLKFIRVYLSAFLFRKRNSVIVIQKVCSNRLYANALKLLILVRSKHTQYDIDDAEYLRQKTKTLHFFLKRCKIISVGSHELKNYCMNFNSNVFVLTSPVTDHNIRKMKRNNKPVIGWVGDFGNGNNITKEFSHKANVYKILFPQLKKIDTPLKLTIIGVKNSNDISPILQFFKDKTNIEIEIPTNLKWKDDDWLYQEIIKFDIGVSPMTNHLFNCSKSAFKAKQYLSVGIPTIASNVGENSRFVLHNKNGIICEKSSDFLTAINRIINMNDKDYFKMSENAINHKSAYSMKKYCTDFIEKYS